MREDAELRLLEPRNAEEFYLLIDRNREHLHFMPFVDWATSVDTQRDFIVRSIRQFADGRGFECGLWYGGKLAGGVGIQPIDLRNRAAALSYWVDRDAEGKGPVTLACTEIINYLLGAMDLNRIVIRAAAENYRSQAVASRLGFRHEGTLRQSETLCGQPVDVEVFSLLKQEWTLGDAGYGSRAFFTSSLGESTELGILEPRHSQEMFNLIDRNRAYLRRWLSWVDETKTVEDTRANRKKMLYEFAENGTIISGIWHDAALAGVIGLHAVSAKCMEIGYWVTEELQGKGLVTASCKAMIGHAFGELGLNRIEIKVQPGNARSRAIPERLGFTNEGTLRQRGVDADGQPVDLMMFSLLNKEWEEQPWALTLRS